MKDKYILDFIFKYNKGVNFIGFVKSNWNKYFNEYLKIMTLNNNLYMYDKTKFIFNFIKFTKLLLYIKKKKKKILFMFPMEFGKLHKKKFLYSMASDIYKLKHYFVLSNHDKSFFSNYKMLNHNYNYDSNKHTFYIKGSPDFVFFFSSFTYDKVILNVLSSNIPIICLTNGKTNPVGINYIVPFNMAKIEQFFYFFKYIKFVLN